jgi:outer membrane protein OmpA-like peptidoglycan-associated protein
MRHRKTVAIEMMKHGLCLKLFKIILLLAFPAFLMMGCAPTTQIVLMPDPDGKVGVLEVSTVKGARTLSTAWQATESASLDRMPDEPRILEEKEVRQTFREALAAEPVAPVSFIMYFKMNRSVLSTESLVLLAKVLDAIESREATDIIISGHTDAVGSVDYNRRLSLRRAKTVADILVARGVDRRIIQMTYHGKGNPLIPTPDGVAEPRNRRVEITVR